MNIFFREMRAHKKALIIWCACMFLLVVSGMYKYTTYSSGGSLGDVFKDMPNTMKALLGIGSFDVTKMDGYFAMLFLYIEIAAAIHAILLGSGIISKEERDKTTEFLMTKPVSRVAIISSKLLASLVNLVIFNIVTLISSILMVASFNKGDNVNGEIVLFLVSMFFVQLVFFSVGTLLASFMRRSKVSGSIAVGILFGTFILAKVTDLNENVDALNVLSPFKYFSYADIVNGNGLNAVVILLSLALVCVCTVFTYVFYRKRDLNV